MKPFRLVFLKPEWGTPIAQLCIRDSTRENYKGEENTVFVSQKCATFKELEYAIDQLHKELDAIKAEGRRQFDV